MPPTTASRVRFIAPFLFALTILLVLLYFVIGLPLRSAKELWRKGATADALQMLENWSRLRLRPADYSNLLAVAYLTAGKGEEARPHLNRLAQRRADWFPVVRKSEVGRRMLAVGRYQEFLRYDTAVRYRGESDEDALYRAAAQLGAGRVAEAETTLSTVDPSDVDPARFAALRSALDERKKGSFSLVLDRNGKTIAAYQLENSDLVAVNQDFAGLIEEQAGSFTIEANLVRLGTANTLHTTLDGMVQKAAVASLGAFRGSLVAIDVTSNELLAVASTPGRGDLRNLAFEGFYEPGSVIKVLTALDAFDSKVDVAKMFPLDCPGFLVLNQRQFFDWAKHGKVADINEAMALSCNVAFGRLGLTLGKERLQQFMKKAGFDGTADLAIYRVPLGKNLSDQLPHEYAIAHYAVGLEYQRINTLHLAMLSSMLANRGRLTVPRLVRGRQSILGEPVGETAALRAAPLVSQQAAQKVIVGMRAVVEHPRGTGRRAHIPDIAMAMKTGTAGEGEGGYDALIMAFAPAGAPRIAIGMIAEDAGPAEFAGARIVHDFYVQVRERLK